MCPYLTKYNYHCSPVQQFSATIGVGTRGSAVPTPILAGICSGISILKPRLRHWVLDLQMAECTDWHCRYACMIIWDAKLAAKYSTQFIAFKNITGSKATQSFIFIWTVKFQGQVSFVDAWRWQILPYSLECLFLSKIVDVSGNFLNVCFS